MMIQVEVNEQVLLAFMSLVCLVGACLIIHLDRLIKG